MLEDSILRRDKSKEEVLKIVVVAAVSFMIVLIASLGLSIMYLEDVSLDSGSPDDSLFDSGGDSPSSDCYISYYQKRTELIVLELCDGVLELQNEDNSSVTNITSLGTYELPSNSTFDSYVIDGDEKRYIEEIST